MNSRFRWLAVPVLAAALVIVGCSGDDEDETNADEPTPTATADASAGASTGATAAPDAPAPAAGDLEDMAALSARLSGGTFSAMYTVEESSVEGIQAGTWKWTQDGANGLTRFDIDSDGEAVTMIMGSDSVTVCAEGTCFSMGGGEEGPIPDVSGLLMGDDPESSAASTSTVTAAPSQTIAGVEAVCYDFEDSADGSSGTVCFAPEGVPLLMEANTTEGDFRLVAESYTTTVAEADFEPPFPVMSFGDLGGLGGTGSTGPAN
jgi:hypothetical protein